MDDYEVGQLKNRVLSLEIRMRRMETKFVKLEKRGKKPSLPQDSTGKAKAVKA